MFHLSILFSLFISCAHRWVSQENISSGRPEPVKKEDLHEDWYHYLSSKGVSRSLCVQGLLERMDDWDCDRIEAKKYNAVDLPIDDRVEVSCLIKKGDQRETYWERNRFIISQPILTRSGLNKINIGRHPAICIDTIHKVEVVKFEDPKTERIRLK